MKSEILILTWKDKMSSVISNLMWSVLISDYGMRCLLQPMLESIDKTRHDMATQTM